MKHVNQYKNTVQVYIIAIIAATGGLLFGFDTGVISGAIPFLQKDFGIDDGVIELITTAGLIGAIAGALFCGKITDYLGRKKVILASAVIFAVGAVWSGLAPDPFNLVLARLFLGIAIGVSSFAVPLYIAEISPTNIRGTLVSMFQLMVTLGVLVSYLSDLYFADETNISCWRPMFYAGIFPALILLIGMFCMPESPRWLMSKGLKKEAMLILRKIEGTESAEKVAYTINEEIEKSKNEISKWSELLKPALRTPLFIAVGIMFFQQFVGINTVIYYSPKIFFMAGFDGAVSAIWAAVGVGGINVIATLVSIYFVDRVGRRKLYFTGLTGIVLSLVALSMSFVLVNELGSVGQWLTVIFMFFYVACFAISIGPLGWLIISEVFPQKVRGLGASVGSLSVWVFNSIVSFTFFKIVNALTMPGSEVILDGEKVGNPAGAFGFYGFIAMMALVWGYFYVPETKGIPLEKIEDFWRKGGKPRELK
ncbi:sugar porter family MFS transporter [Bacteroides fluxus]|uniref:sugar porter family MFS transporter n=1 Tax=Bacteroides fluxus TaxID=626930 RepID=UPI0023F2F234|nr:sugar porter family MFS transporter [Bacteroides fluxus]